jgi:hypothetical protein
LAPAAISGQSQLSIRDGSANKRLISWPFFFFSLQTDGWPSLIHHAELLLSAKAA